MRKEISFYMPRIPVSIFLFVSLTIAVSALAIRKQQDATAEKSSNSPTESKPSEPLPSDRQLAALIDQAIDSSQFASARWGVSVISLSDGHVVYARNADKLFTPASNMKIYTTAVALDLLGADYRWRTSVYASQQPDANGSINADLTLYGRGAPDLLSRSKGDQPSSLAQLANDLYQRGVRHVRGNVIGDESYFRAEPLGHGWQWDDVQWYFGAEPSALSIDGNEVDVEIKPSGDEKNPPVVTLDSAQSYVRLTTSTATVRRGEPMTIGIQRGLSDNNLKVWGDFPVGGRSFGARLSIHDPALWAAELFIEALRKRGISIDGEPRTRDFRVPEKERFDPARASELAFFLSKPLGEIIRATNKESINLNAELILRTLGKERGETAPDVDPRKTHTRGDDEAGNAVVLQWLSRARIATNDLALHDGSGLSRLDLIKPETTARLLLAISKTASASVFRDSLPLAGHDGTLAGRLHKYKDRISAKTGSLTYDNSLSGFVNTADGEPLVFSVMCNDQTARTSSVRVIDEVVSILADYSSSKGKKP
jgi:serine-type D-Ala-D-Ala carboxypeptidase/endopeptidase (penicillin-binding protein 4)